MRRMVIVALASLAACSRGAERRADSVAAQAVDTLKPAPPGDTLAASPAKDTLSTKRAPATRTPTTKTTKTDSTKLGRDSAFPPPKNLPRLDTVKRKPGA